MDSVTDSVNVVVSSVGREAVVSEAAVLSAAAICDSITSFAPVGRLPTLLFGSVFAHPENRSREMQDSKQIVLFIILTFFERKPGIRKSRIPG